MGRVLFSILNCHKWGCRSEPCLQQAEPWNVVGPRGLRRGWVYEERVLLWNTRDKWAKSGSTWGRMLTWEVSDSAASWGCRLSSAGETQESNFGNILKKPEVILLKKSPKGMTMLVHRFLATNTQGKVFCKLVVKVENVSEKSYLSWDWIKYLSSLPLWPCLGGAAAIYVCVLRFLWSCQCETEYILMRNLSKCAVPPPHWGASHPSGVTTVPGHLVVLSGTRWTILVPRHSCSQWPLFDWIVASVPKRS